MKTRKNQPLVVPLISDKEMNRRHQEVKKIMEKGGLAALIVSGSQVNFGSGSHHIRYLTNFGVYYGEVNLVFPLAGEPVLFCRSINQEYTASQVSFVSTRVSSQPAFARDVAGYVKELRLEEAKIGIVGGEVMPAYVFIELCQLLPKVKFSFVSHELLNLRMVKSKEELDMTRKAGEIADSAYKAIQKTARPGVWEYEVLAAAEQAFLANGAFSPSFLLLSSGKSPSFPGAPASHRRLEKGDTILEELSPCYGGYWVQWGRPFVLGKPSEDLEDLFQVTLEAYHLVLEELRPGNIIGQLRKKLSAFVEGRGYIWLARPDQFIGLDITEQNFFITGEKYSAKPVFRPIDERELLPGMVVVNQPNIVTKDLSKGMLLIDTCIVTEKEPEVLSHSPLKYTVI